MLPVNHQLLVRFYGAVSNASWRIALIFLGTCLTASGSSTIINRSPFIPSGFNPSALGTTTRLPQDTATGYEFRGVYQIGDRYWFLISEPKSRDGNWIELGQNSQELFARDYDPNSKLLTVSANNTEYRLELAELDANPVPIPVQGLVKSTSRTPIKAPTPVRRTVRPTTGSATTVKPQQTRSTSAPAPAWLEKLRTEAAERRARAGGQGQQGQRDASNQGQMDPRRRVITPNRPSQQSQKQGGQKTSKDGSRQPR